MTGFWTSLETSISQLVDGFTSLCDEYKLLAQRHKNLERRLAATTLECQSLRDLLPSVKSPANIVLEDPGGLAGVTLNRSLDEWLEETVLIDSETPNISVARIKEAEFACFKVQTKLHGDHNAVVAPLENTASHRRGIGQIPEQAMEKDFTIPRNAGKLGCPFASVGGPRSFSQSDQNGKPSKRLSLNDPFRSDVGFSPAISPVEAPACPIRYLDQHSPEDIAAYFEQHKHELPRSHEVCVKRFQDNADSIRELDAKYGNLVSMIQGLGQKHQPMLPDTPTQDKVAAEEDEEQRSNQKIRQWAKSVGEDQPEDGENDHISKINNNPVSPNGEDDRMSHFDRPYKEIRVGESPSRPWGVPIPSKYFDRKVRSGSISSADSVPGTEESTKHVTAANSQTQLNAIHPTASPKYRPASTSPKKCQNTRKDPAEPSARSIMQAAQVPQSNFEHEFHRNGKCAFDRISTHAGPPASPRSAHPASRPSHSIDMAPSMQPYTPDCVPAGLLNAELKTSNIFNYGVAVIAQSKHLEHHTLTNHGTLILGYGEASASKLMKAALGRT